MITIVMSNFPELRLLEILVGIEGDLIPESQPRLVSKMLYYGRR
jgi:hypothetical protein